MIREVLLPRDARNSKKMNELGIILDYLLFGGVLIHDKALGPGWLQNYACDVCRYEYRRLHEKMNVPWSAWSPKITAFFSILKYTCTNESKNPKQTKRWRRHNQHNHKQQHIQRRLQRMGKTNPRKWNQSPKQTRNLLRLPQTSRIESPHPRFVVVIPL